MDTLPDDTADQLEFAELVDEPVPSSPDVPYGVPRRFSLGTVMIVTACFGLMLVGLIRWGLSRAVIAIVVVEVATVAVGQVALFGGKQPRKASIVAGIGFMFVVMIGVAWYDAATHAKDTPGVSTLIVMALPFAASGAFFGYISGGAVAGIFLIMDKTEELLRLVSGRAPTHQQPPGN